MTTIAFIGLGHMGLPMARNLLKAGFAVTAFDLAQEALDAFAQDGGKRAASAAEAVRDALVVVSMQPASRHVEGLYLGDDGLLQKITPGSLVLECSTIAPDSARKVHAAAAARGIALLDAPVSGGTAGAAAGTLTFMVGANQALFDTLHPVLAQMGRNIVHCGDVGTGQVAKICNNLLLGISMVGVSEAMALGAALGIDSEVLAGVINSSTGRCWSSEVYNPWPGIVATAPASRGYTGGFGAELMLKDLGLATEAARQAHQPVVMGAVAQQLYQAMSLRGEGGKDFSAIINSYRKPQ